MSRGATSLGLAALLAVAPWHAGAAGSDSPRSITLPGGVGVFAAAPSLHKFYALGQRSRGKDVLDVHDARDGRVLRVVRACANPVSLSTNQTLARLYVLCSREVDDDVQASSLVTVDMRSDRVIGVVVLHDEAELQVAAEPGGIVALSASHPVVLDPRTGRVVRTLRGAGRVVAVSGLSGMMLCWDPDGRFLQLVTNDGRVRGTFDPGLGRGPVDAAYDAAAHRLYVAFHDAGAIAVFDIAGALVRTLPVADGPSLIRYDARRDRLIVVCEGAPAAPPALIAMRTDGSERRTVVLSPSALAQSDTHERLVLDDVSGRIAVAGVDALDVVEGDASRVVATLYPPNARFAGMEGAAGTLIVAWSGSATILDRVELRTVTPADMRPASTTNVVSHPRDATPPRIDVAARFPVDPPRGVRSPRWIAFAPDGSIVIVALGSDMLGRLRAGQYEERRVALHSAAAGLAVDAAGTAWLTEQAHSDGSVYLARVAPDGALREIALPRDFAAPGTVPVVDGDGTVWLYAPAGSGRVARIGARDGVRVFALPRHEPQGMFGPRQIVALGHGAAVMDDRLWAVARDGAVRALTAPLDVRPSTNLAAAADGTISFAGNDALVDVGAGGGIVGTPLDPLTLRMVRSAQTLSRLTACFPRDVVHARDGSAWLTCGDAVAHVTRDGTVRSFPLPDAQSAPSSLIVAPDGAVWFAEPAHSRIGRMAADGTLTETPI